MQLNVLAPIILTRAVLTGMVERGEGAVINIASLLAFSGSWEAPHLPQRAVYAASKSFLLTFTQILAAELRGSGVRIQVVCPGVVRTEFRTRQGMDPSALPRMEPGPVVEASLFDLAGGVIVSIPGAGDESILDRAAEARALDRWPRPVPSTSRRAFAHQARHLTAGGRPCGFGDATVLRRHGCVGRPLTSLDLRVRSYTLTRLLFRRVGARRARRPSLKRAGGVFRHWGGLRRARLIRTSQGE